jgi:hypothetical protein
MRFLSWLLANAGPVIAGVITGIVGTLTVILGSSVGDVLTDWLERGGFDPTEAVVVGKVTRDGVGVPGVRIDLYDPDERGPNDVPILQNATTDSDGSYQINDVGAGSYNAVATWNGNFLGRSNFAVADNQEETQVSPVLVRSDFVFIRRFEPGMPFIIKSSDTPSFTQATTDSVAATPIAGASPVATSNSPSSAQSGSSSLSLTYRTQLQPEIFRQEAGAFGVLTYLVQVSLTGDAATLENVLSVEYVLPPEYFWPNRTFRFGNEQFKLSFYSWGELTVHARVYFIDGTTQDIALFIALGNNTFEQ